MEVKDISISNEKLEWEDDILMSSTNGLVKGIGDCYSSDFDDLLKKIEAEDLKSGKIFKTKFNQRKVRVLDDNKIVLLPNCYSRIFGNRNTENLKRGNKECSVKDSTIMRAIRNLFLISDRKRLTKSKIEYRCVLITLTARHDGSIRNFETKMWKAWRLFYMRIKNNIYKDFLFVLSKERHKSGYIHYHIIANIPYINVQNLNEIWLECLDRFGLKGSKAALDLRAIHERKGIDACVRYVSKYVTKQNSWNSGKIIGFSATFSKGLSKKIKLEISKSEMIEIEKQIKFEEKIELEPEIAQWFDGDFVFIELKKSVFEFDFMRQKILDFRDTILKLNEVN